MTGKLYKIQISCRADIKNEIYITSKELLLNPISSPIRFYRVRHHTSFTPKWPKLRDRDTSNYKQELLSILLGLKAYKSLFICINAYTSTHGYRERSWREPMKRSYLGWKASFFIYFYYFGYKW